MTKFIHLQPKTHLSIISRAKFKENPRKMTKIESENEFLTSIKGYNSGLNWQNLPTYNPKLPPYYINSYTKFEENPSKMLKMMSGNEALTDGQTDGRTDGQTDGRTYKSYSIDCTPELSLWIANFTHSALIPDLKHYGMQL